MPAVVDAAILAILLLFCAMIGAFHGLTPGLAAAALVVLAFFARRPR